MKNFLERQLVRLLLSRGGPLLQKAVTAAAAAALTYIATKSGLDIRALGVNEAVIAGIIWGILDIAVTRIASGLPVGSDLEFADELTLGRALSNRTAIED